MPTRRMQLDPVGNYNFVVDGISSGVFSNVEGLNFEVEMIEYRDSENPSQIRFRPGLTKASRITLKRGFLTGVDMNQWIEKIGAGEYERKDGLIQLMDNAGNVVASWDILRCMPTKWSMSGFEGKGNGTSVETIELVVEEIKRTDKSSTAPEGPKEAGFWEKIGGAVGGAVGGAAGAALGASAGGALDARGGIDGNFSTRW
jgi:phage tail-like protein